MDESIALETGTHTGTIPKKLCWNIVWNNVKIMGNPSRQNMNFQDFCVLPFRLVLFLALVVLVDPKALFILLAFV